MGAQRPEAEPAPGLPEVQEPELEQAESGKTENRGVSRTNVADDSPTNEKTMNASVSNTALNEFLYAVLVVGGATAPTPTRSECSQFDDTTPSRNPSARRRRIVALRRWMTRTCGRAKKDARHSALGLLHPDATHRDRGERSPADHRQMMAGYCNAALRRRRRREPMPPPPRYPQSRTRKTLPYDRLKSCQCNQKREGQCCQAH